MVLWWCLRGCRYGAKAWKARKKELFEALRRGEGEDSLASDSLGRQALLERLERAEDLLRSLTDCLVRARARLLNVIDREGVNGKARSDFSGLSGEDKHGNQDFRRA